MKESIKILTKLVMVPKRMNFKETTKMPLID